MTTAAMRDSSTDYRTYWLRDGLYYSRMRTLGEASCALPKEKLSQIPEADRKLILDEIDGNPAFCVKLARCMAARPDWAHRIAQCAKQAIVNEMDPTKFPERKGDWPKLRARVRELAESAKAQALRAAARLTPEGRLAVVRSLAAAGGPARGLSGLGALGQWDIIGSLVTSVAGAGASVYGAKVTADAREDIAKYQASSAMQSAQAQIAMANAQAAIAQAQAAQSPIGSAISNITSATIGGIPVLAIAVPVIGLILYFALKK